MQGLASSTMVRNGLGSLRGKSVYFIGIGGTGMRALAQLLLDGGSRVYGSDLQLSPAILSLQESGASITLKQDGSWVSPRMALVVTSAAIEEDNPDLRAARSLGLTVLKYSQVLGFLMGEKLGIAIGGTHGKTTTTAMISTILRHGGKDPSFVIGGEVKELGGGSGLGRGRYFVAEACEYDRSFLNLNPHIAVITNIEEDHLDYYQDLDGIINAFGEFASKVSRGGLVVAHEDESVRKALGQVCSRVETYSLEGPSSDWSATPPTWQGGRNRFDAYYKGRFFGSFSLRIPGGHNVLNALASMAVCHFAGVDREAIEGALRNYRGARRRFQVLDTIKEVTVVDDYGHHPTEISLTLRAARQYFPSRRLWCVFQPHQHSRTRKLLKGFARAFQEVDHAVFTDIYPARDCLEETKAVSTLDLLTEARHLGVKAVYVPGVTHVAREIYPQLHPGDVVMTMGAGNVWQVGVALVSLLKNGAENGGGYR